MDNIIVRQGTTLPLEVSTNKEEAAMQVNFIVRETKDSPILIDKMASFDNGVAYIELTVEDTNVAIGEYLYQFKVFYENAIDKFPTTFDCDTGDCSFPKFIICESLDS